MSHVGSMGGTTRTNAIVTCAIGLIVLYILFAERGSKEFFSG
jgi:hypothetical protein